MLAGTGVWGIPDFHAEQFVLENCGESVFEQDND